MECAGAWKVFKIWEGNSQKIVYLEGTDQFGDVFLSSVITTQNHHITKCAMCWLFWALLLDPSADGHNMGVCAIYCREFRT